MKLIPAIDLLDGCCVRLFQGDYEQVTRYRGDPVSLAQSYADAGADALHVVDLGAARDGSRRDWRVLEAICRAVSAPVQAGGGLRRALDLEAAFDCGVTRAVVGTRAVQDPEAVGRWLDRVGAERLCLALDVRFDGEGLEPMLATHGWRRDSGWTLWRLLERLYPAIRHVLCTEISRDGTLGGANETLYRQAVSRFPSIRWQASGGVAELGDLRAIADTGADACIIGRALLDGRFSLREARRCLRAA